MNRSTTERNVRTEARDGTITTTISTINAERGVAIGGTDMTVRWDHRAGYSMKVTVEDSRVAFLAPSREWLEELRLAIDEVLELSEEKED